MTGKHKIILSGIMLVLVALFIYIILGKHGYSDLTQLKQEQMKSIQKNERLVRENRALGIEIDRLKHDIGYIESIARQDLGMIRKEEIILKPNPGQPELKIED
jgi:cell division protein FtsB